MLHACVQYALKPHVSLQCVLATYANANAPAHAQILRMHTNAVGSYKIELSSDCLHSSWWTATVHRQKIWKRCLNCLMIAIRPFASTCGDVWRKYVLYISLSLSLSLSLSRYRPPCLCVCVCARACSRARAFSVIRRAPRVHVFHMCACYTYGRDRPALVHTSMVCKYAGMNVNLRCMDVCILWFLSPFWFIVVSCPDYKLFFPSKPTFNPNILVGMKNYPDSLALMLSLF